jgi:CubicO group peptidase (beta-lactamase class C family)
MSPSDLPTGSFSHTGFTGTYVLGVPSAKVGIVLLTNKQNVGANARGMFSNIAPLDLAVAHAVLRAVNNPNVRREEPVSRVTIPTAATLVSRRAVVAVLTAR